MTIILIFDKKSIKKKIREKKKMRPVVTPLQSSSEGDVYEMENLFENDPTIENMVNYASALARSPLEEQVIKSQEIVSAALEKEDAEKVIYELEELKILALYRLSKDSECKAEIEKAYLEHKRTLIISNVKKYYDQIKYERNVKIALASAGAALIGSICYFVFRKKK